MREIFDSARYDDSDEEDLQYDEVLDLGYVDEVITPSSPDPKNLVSANDLPFFTMQALLEREVELVSPPEGERHVRVTPEPALFAGGSSGGIGGLSYHSGGPMEDGTGGIIGPSGRLYTAAASPSDGLIESEILTADGQSVRFVGGGVTPSLRQEAWIEQGSTGGCVVQSAGDQGHCGDQRPSTAGQLDCRGSSKVKLESTRADRAEAITQEW